MKALETLARKLRPDLSASSQELRQRMARLMPDRFTMSDDDLSVAVGWDGVRKQRRHESPRDPQRHSGRG